MSDVNNLENKIIKMEAKIDNLCEKFDTYHEDNKEQHKEMGVVIKELTEKKADKETVEEIRNDIRKVGWIVVGAVIVTILASLGLKVI